MPCVIASPGWSGSLARRQPNLFTSDEYPPGFRIRFDFIDAAEERGLVHVIEELEFSSVEMRGGVAKRRTVHYGRTYAYGARTTGPGVEIPSFLLPLRARVAAWAGLEPEAFGEALITEYPAGAGIGWHRDAPMFGDIIAGVSLGSGCRMKFRPYISPKDLVGPARPPRRATHEVILPERSGYLIADAARRDFEHSIPETSGLRYSITFRTLRSPVGVRSPEGLRRG
jgi:alkylated DNA repair protein (DNA oxidative demethylase)